MTALLRRLWPDTFGGQLIVALLLSIIALFAVNFYAVYLMQAKFLGVIEKERSDNITAFFTLLSGMTPGQRDDTFTRLADLQRAANSSLLFRLMPDAPTLRPTPPQAAQAVAVLQKNLSNNGLAVLPEIRAWVSTSRTPAIGDGWDSTAADTARYSPLLHMAVSLDCGNWGGSWDGNWLSITQPLYTNAQKMILLQRLNFLLQFAAFALLVSLLLRKLVRPFQEFTQAVHQVGIQPEAAAPLPEKGCRELRRAAQSFNRMQSRIRVNHSERDRMLAAMAHDLRTPLTRAQLRIEAVEPEALRTKLLANIGEIRSIAEQSLELARSLNMSERPVPLDIVTFVQSCVDDFAETGNPVSMPGLASASLPSIAVRARPLCLKRCIENLLHNAVSYGKNAEVTITFSENEVFIDICDNGPGVPEALIKQIFEPYFRLESSRNRESGGTGLGLSIARNMAILNNGTLSLDNRPQGGLLARIALPRLWME